MCSVCVCVHIHNHTPTYTPTRVNNGEDTDNTPISPSVKNKTLRQATNAWPGLAEIPHLRSPTLDEQTRVVRWKTRRAFKMAPRHHAFTQKRKAQPIWIELWFSHRRWQTSKVGSRMEVECLTVTWFCSSPRHSEGVENKLLSQRRCVVVNYLNKFETYLANGSRGPLHNIVVVRNMRFVVPKV